MDVDYDVWKENASHALDGMLKTFDEQGFLNDDQKKALSNMMNTVTNQIKMWDVQKLRAQVGQPVPQSSELDKLQPLCEKVALLLFKQMQQMKQYMCLSGVSQPLDCLRCFKEMFDESQETFAAFIKRCLVIEKQPSPIVVKGSNGKRIEVSLRLLLGKRFFQEISNFPCDATCSLHLESEVRCFYDKIMNKNPETSYVIITSISGTFVSRFDSNVTVHEDNIIIKNMCFKEDRAGVLRVMENKVKLPSSKKNTECTATIPKQKSGRSKKNTVCSSSSSQQGCSEKVPEQKSCFLFGTQVTIDGQSFPIETISAPFVVLSKPDYEREAAEATVFWDNAFGDKDRKPFVVPDEVPLEDFLSALNYRWSMTNERELEKKQLEHLTRKLFQGNMHIYKVSKAMFHKPIKTQYDPFTFSEWFFQILKFVHDFMKEEWKNGHIQLFIDRSEAEQSLQDKPVGTFLLRCSDTSLPSNLGGITVVYKNNKSECTSHPPWTKAELEEKSLSQRIRKNSEFVCVLHPTLQQKEKAFILLTEERRTHPGYPIKKKKRVQDNEFSPLAADSPDSGFVSHFDPSMSPCVDQGENQFTVTGHSDRDPVLSQTNVQCWMDNLLNMENRENMNCDGTAWFEGL